MIEILMKKIDLNKDGKIQYREFVGWLVGDPGAGNFGLAQQNVLQAPELAHGLAASAVVTRQGTTVLECAAWSREVASFVSDADQNIKAKVKEHLTSGGKVLLEKTASFIEVTLYPRDWHDHFLQVMRGSLRGAGVTVSSRSGSVPSGGHPPPQAQQLPAGAHELTGWSEKVAELLRGVPHEQIKRKLEQHLRSGGKAQVTRGPGSIDVTLIF